jgi:hypothetical protein
LEKQSAGKSCHYCRNRVGKTAFSDGLIVQEAVWNKKTGKTENDCEMRKKA